MPNQLAHFAIHVDDSERARRFYGGVFGWTFQSYGGGPLTDFCLIRDSEGRELKPIGAMQSRRFNTAPQPVYGYECSIAVDDVDAATTAVTAHGGKIVMPKTPVPGVGWLIKFLDSEGNLVCAIRFDPAAK
jgi:uncharacterized protein